VLVSAVVRDCRRAAVAQGSRKQLPLTCVRLCGSMLKQAGGTRPSPKPIKARMDHGG
jgi:hypothetical protein